MSLKIDHATFGASELELLRQAFASVGLATEYGGPHANGVTHMALLGLDDGSYLELIAPLRPGVVAGSDWGEFMTGDAEACAWAVGSEDIRREVARLKQSGIELRGPSPGSRKKPDGTLIQWETASVGPGTTGATLPFMIQDKTPRTLRVMPSPSVEGSGLTGVEIVVLGVTDLDASIALFRQAYGWSEPKREQQEHFGAKLAHFPGTPVMLASALDQDFHVSERAGNFRDRPVAYLLGTHDRGKAERFALGPASTWFGRNVAWFDETKLMGAKLGLIG